MKRQLYLSQVPSLSMGRGLETGELACVGSEERMYVRKCENGRTTNLYVLKENLGDFTMRAQEMIT